MTRFWIFFPVVAAVSLFAKQTARAEDIEIFTIKTLPAQMRYDVTELTISPRTQVKIIFENSDDMPHNMVFFQPGTDVVAVSNKQLEKPDEALKRNWLPEDPRMWLHSKLLNPKEREEIVFTAPDKPGIYPFVCTFPGHAVTMQGRLKIFAPGPKLSGLKFQLFLGSWTRLPNFSALTPHREGNVPDNLVQLKLDDYKNQFGAVFSGKITAPKDGEYAFSLAGDDGVRISIDGKRIVEDDGVHPASDLREGRTRLQAGEHDFRLEYFQASGEAEIFVAWRGPDFSMTPLSKSVHPDWKAGVSRRKKDNNTGMPLVVRDEPIVYRNFIAGAGNRAIAVGYPGGFNIAWSAETMNLAFAWRGAFIDAARHWTDRGAGHQPPLGYDLIRPAQDAPFAILADASARWPEMDRKQRGSGYEWKGYQLDKARIPTFFYKWNGIAVTDRFETAGHATAIDGKLVRTLDLRGTLPPDAYFRIATGANIRSANDSFSVDGGKFGMDGRDFENRFTISAEGAFLRGNDLVVPLRPKIRVTYAWPDAHAHHAMIEKANPSDRPGSFGKLAPHTALSLSQ
jgi:azurin